MSFTVCKFMEQQAVESQTLKFIKENDETAQIPLPDSNQDLAHSSVRESRGGGIYSNESTSTTSEDRQQSNQQCKIEGDGFD